VNLKKINQHLENYPQSLLHHFIFPPNLILRYFNHLNRVKKYSKTTGLKSIPFRKLRKYKQRNTLFILGSGSSINNISEYQWNVIENKDSVGFNFWLIHDFVPTYYVAEIKGEENRMTIFYQNLINKIRHYTNIPFIFKYREALSLKDFSIISKLNYVFLAPTIRIPGVNKKAFSKWILLLDLIRFFSKNNNNGFIPFKQASVSWLIIFALKLGYKNIVLCGIDLNNTDYFFEQNKAYYFKKNILIPPSGQDGKIHMTNDPDHCYGELIIKDVIDVLYRKLLRRKNINLYVGSPSSALYPDIPLYDW